MSERVCNRCKTRAMIVARQNICRACYNARMRDYMQSWRYGRPRKYADWRGINANNKVRAHVQAEARDRGVPVETVIQEWGLRQ